MVTTKKVINATAGRGRERKQRKEHPYVEFDLKFKRKWPFHPNCWALKQVGKCFPAHKICICVLCGFAVPLAGLGKIKPDDSTKEGITRYKLRNFLTFSFLEF